MHFAEDLYKKDLTLDEAEEDKKEMLKKINELKKIINSRTGPKPKKSNKEKMENGVKNSEGIYNFKNKIINIIKEEQGYSSKSDEKTKDKSVNLKWIKYPDNFENLINGYNTDPDFGVDFVDDNKSVNLKNIGNFINDIVL